MSLQGQGRAGGRDGMIQQGTIKLFSMTKIKYTQINQQY